MTGSAKITADASAAQAKKNESYFKKLLQGMHMDGSHMAPMREADYNGHHITIKTTYEIEIDGKPFMGTLDVSNAGTVHYHGMPTAGFASALDLVKSVIDVFPDEFAAGSGGPMEGMDMKRMGGSRKKPEARRKSARHK